jgi:hypothetical protein
MKIFDVWPLIYLVIKEAELLYVTYKIQEIDNLIQSKEIKM